jgi:hypothetical protein
MQMPYTNASTRTPMQMPHSSLFLLLLLFILIVWNNAASYKPLVIYYIAQGQTLLRKMCVGGSKSVQAKLCSFIYFFCAARACHRFTTVTIFKNSFLAYDCDKASCNCDCACAHRERKKMAHSSARQVPHQQTIIGILYK